MKLYLTFTFALFAFLTAYLLAGETVPSEGISSGDNAQWESAAATPVPAHRLGEIIEKVKMQQSKIVEEIEDAIFLAESIYREREKDDELKKELVVKKRVYVKRGGRRYEEYLGMILNGRDLYGKELEKEIKDWKKKARRQQETKMPLTPEGEGAYDYQLIGSATRNGMELWVVGFRARQRKDGYINGRGYVSKDSFNIVHAEFAPAKISRVIEDMKMSLTYSEVQGYWMPVKFELSMKIKVGFLVDLFYRDIKIEDTYSEYQFNNQLEDSLFGSEQT